jgi:hypothetical protein
MMVKVMIDLFGFADGFGTLGHSALVFNNDHYDVSRLFEITYVK